MQELAVFPKKENLNVAYFISPHGFGHGTRAAAVMNEIFALNPSIHFDIYTLVPQWIFEQSFTFPFTYHSFLTDIGLVQKSPLQEDIPETISSLNNFFPFDSLVVKKLAGNLRKRDCKLVICDIAPLGIAVAKEMGGTSLLIENFTWDWIYEEYKKYDYGFYKHIKYLSEIFSSADYHIQTEPVCRYVRPDLTTAPVSRRISENVTTVRERLGLPVDAQVVLITMGGINEDCKFLDKLESFRSVKFLIPGASEKIQNNDNLILLPKQSEFYHPDLVNTCNAVIGKAGYSTVAEVYNAGIPFAFVTRKDFRESSVMEQYIMKHMDGFPINETEFHSCNWLLRLSELLTYQKKRRASVNSGAKQAARFICKILG